ncbi:uncharacterized protein [Onthophagus taurus]|uniref:uncharacterized protein n=1 Tax=Onthophagus taurus TaxID=166361 RepID=UPI000C20D7C6|nr:uncharacterized protein LOC111427144 [Onthophagus taurus]
METCRCEEYKKLVEEHQFHSFGHLDRKVKLHQLPERHCIQWCKNRIGDIADNREYKPVIKPFEKQPERIIQCLPPVPEKWMPVTPGLVSLKLINQTKMPTCPF